MSRASTQPKIVKFIHKGKRYKFASLVLAAKHFNIPVVPVYARIRIGWKSRLALVTPLRWQREDVDDNWLSNFLEFYVKAETGN